MAFEIARAGWLFRESSFLKRWKKNWFVLYRDGVLKYFDSPDSHVAEEAELMPARCINLKTGSQIVGVNPPEGYGRSCLLTLMFRDTTGYKTWNVCAESPDDMSAWQLALEEARYIQATPQRNCISAPPPPYSAIPPGGAVGHYEPGMYPAQGGVTYVYPNGMAQGQTTYVYPTGMRAGHHPYTVQGQNGQTVVVMQDRRRQYDGMDLATGVVAGAALGSLMWWPMMF